MSTRCFVALLPDAATREALGALRPRRGTGCTPVEVNDLHVTLQFCAALDDAGVAAASTALPALATALPPLAPAGFTIWTTSERRAALVLRYRSNDQIRTLHEALGRLFDNERTEPPAWCPHVTLARGDPAHLGDSTSCSVKELPSFRGRSLALIASMAGPGGYAHKVVASQELPALGESSHAAPS